MNTVVISTHVELATVTCISCGIIYGIPVEKENQRKRDGSYIFCPNGHQQAYSKTIEQELREQLANEKKKLATTQFELMAAKEKTQSVEKAKAHLEKRIKNGVCPCCHHQFIQLTRHMKSKHPDYTTGKA